MAIAAPRQRSHSDNPATQYSHFDSSIPGALEADHSPDIRGHEEPRRRKNSPHERYLDETRPETETIQSARTRPSTLPISYQFPQSVPTLREKTSADIRASEEFSLPGLNPAPRISESTVLTSRPPPKKRLHSGEYPQRRLDTVTAAAPALIPRSLAHCAPDACTKDLKVTRLLLGLVSTATDSVFQICYAAPARQAALSFNGLTPPLPFFWYCSSRVFLAWSPLAHR
ncbi:hypothetical protein QBC44DRAFT_372380 [Cladorrhinum sp. PSN332]|nr:hypothetical protein QBC44DRAFT_372380 [Cladorrhinum sp. PSN332]